MNSPLDDAGIQALRAWMRNERRLGIEHVAVPPPLPADPLSTVRAAVSGTRPPGGLTAQDRPVRSPAPAPAGAGLHPTRSGPAPRTVSLPRAASDGLPPMCDATLDAPAAQDVLTSLDVGFVRGCTKCVLHQQRKQTVFGVGNSRPELVFVGEGPGADEDAQGIPFVGRAGQLLTRMIAAMTLTREQVYICNVVKCRPPGNRTPTFDEMEACSPYLFRQLAVLRPKVIVTLGAPATQTLLATRTPIGRLRGRFHDFPPPPLAQAGLPTCRLMPTFHPAYLLRSPDEKAKAWDDLKQVMGLLGLAVPS